MPKVKGALESFRVRSIPAYQRHSEMITTVLPLLYAEGLSTRDFERALGRFWEDAGLSRSSISRANKMLHDQFDAWRRRDLSDVKVMYLFLDGYYERVRFDSTQKEGVLVAHGVLEDGSRQVLAIALGPKERTFREARRRTDVVGRFPTEKSALVLIWATIEQERLKWRGLRMHADTLEIVREASRQLAADPIVLTCARDYLAAA